MATENLKTYVQSNVFKSGEGPDTWRSTTLTAKNEIYGAAQVAIADFKEQEAVEEAVKKAKEE